MMNVYNKEFLTSQAMNANFNSVALELYEMYGCSISAVVTGTPTGSIRLEVSNDPLDSKSGYTPGNFNTIAGSSFSLTTSGITTWNVPAGMYNYIRLSYTDTSGGTSTATVTARINAKG